MIVSKNDFKYFLGYKDDRKVTPLCIILPKIRAYRRDFDETKYISFSVKNDKLLVKCNQIWGKVSNNIKKGSDREPASNEKYIKTKIKYYEGKISTNFHCDKVPKEGSQYICLSVILIDSVFRTGKNYYPQVFF